MYNKYALFHVISLEEITFYSRFFNALKKDYSLKPVFITTSLFCFLYLKLRRIDTYLTLSKNTITITNQIVNNSFNEKVGWLDREGAQNCFLSTLEKVQKLTCHNDVSIAFIPSGRLVSHQATIKHCRELGIPIIFSGYGNFPGKTFFDPEGTDKASSLFVDNSRLDRLHIDLEKFEKWRIDYINKKLKKHVVSQAKKISFKTYISRFARIIFCSIERLIGVHHDINRTWSSLSELKGGNVSKLKDSMVIPDRYVLFPLQYSLDAQIILNYNGNYKSAILDAIHLARKKTLPLVIKPHPVENSCFAIDFVKRIVNENDDVFISNANTFELIKNSELVITVNSTVGLESKLMHKSVIFLGDSIYKNMSHVQCAKYIQDYLVDIDYFEKEDISSSTMKKIFGVCGVHLD